jgi:hypothetical protein
MAAIELLQLQKYRSDLLGAMLGGSGAKTVTDQNGETVTYRSIKEIQTALAACESMIANFHRKPVRTILFATNKGLF